MREEEKRWDYIWIAYPDSISGFFMTDKAVEAFLKIALELAKRGRGQTSPNPMVGAVIVKNGQIVGQGYHRRAGSPHAEVMAIKEARGLAKGATLFVNLEPCCHYGRTDPCTDAIISAGISRAIFCMKDPNPKVNGKGASILRRAGITVDMGILKNEAMRLNEAYIKFIETGLPFVILKTAQSLDGRIATASGDSRWISCPASREFAHSLRASADAVAVGAGAVRADDPQLTVRLVKGKNPYRIIISRHPDFPPRINLFARNGDAKTILATSTTSLKKIEVKNLIFWHIKKNKDGLSLLDFLRKAGAFGIQTLLVEGGGRLATSFLSQGLVDRLYLVIAPMIIGKGTEAVGELNIRKLIKAIRFDSPGFMPCGDDILFSGYPIRK